MPLIRCTRYSHAAPPPPHRDVHITNWRDVQVVLMTHAIDGLAMADFVMAAKFDVLPVEYRCV